MKALNHLHNRFEYAIKGTKTIKVNQHDIEALNTLIQEENNRKRNTALEDALILFYLLMTYKVTNKKNKAILQAYPESEIKFPMGLPEASNTLARLSVMINPKKEVIRMIADELWIYQEYERIPKDKAKYLDEVRKGIDTPGADMVITKQEYVPIPEDNRITFDQVEELLEKALQSAKENFPMFKAMNNDFFRFIEPVPLSKMKL